MSSNCAQRGVVCVKAARLTPPSRAQQNEGRGALRPAATDALLRGGRADGSARAHKRRRVHARVSGGAARRSRALVLTPPSARRSHGIVHRDLKPENLLLSEKSTKGVVKLSDFGLSKLLQPGEQLTAVCGTWAYSGARRRQPPAWWRTSSLGAFYTPRAPCSPGDAPPGPPWLLVPGRHVVPRATRLYHVRALAFAWI